MDNDELLFRYFRGTLSEDEQAMFEKRLEEDAGFREQFEFEKNVQTVIKHTERTNLKKKLQGLESTVERSSVKRRNFWKPFRIAASIAFLIAAGWYFYTIASSESTEELYAANYDKYPNTVYSITRSDTLDTSFERKAFEAYEASDHEAAIRYFEELSTKSGLDYIDFYLAQSYLANGETQKGLDLLEKIVSEDTDFKAEALWYASLASLKLDQKDRAIEKLEALIKDGSYKKEPAWKLLKKLD